MTTSILSETRLSLSKAAQHLGVNVSTVWRWTLRGVRGHRLESALVGGLRFTSHEAIDRFTQAINAGPGEAPQVRTPKQRQAADDRAAKRLTAAGI
jgi:hypothetical protein